MRRPSQPSITSASRGTVSTSRGLTGAATLTQPNEHTLRPSGGALARTLLAPPPPPRPHAKPPGPGLRPGAAAEQHPHPPRSQMPPPTAGPLAAPPPPQRRAMHGSTPGGPGALAATVVGPVPPTPATQTKTASRVPPQTPALLRTCAAASAPPQQHPRPPASGSVSAYSVCQSQSATTKVNAAAVAQQWTMNCAPTTFEQSNQSDTVLLWCAARELARSTSQHRKELACEQLTNTATSIKNLAAEVEQEASVLWDLRSAKCAQRVLSVVNSTESDEDVHMEEPKDTMAEQYQVFSDTFESHKTLYNAVEHTSFHVPARNLTCNGGIEAMVHAIQASTKMLSSLEEAINPVWVMCMAGTHNPCAAELIGSQVRKTCDIVSKECVLMEELQSLINREVMELTEYTSLMLHNQTSKQMIGDATARIRPQSTLQENTRRNKVYMASAATDTSPSSASPTTPQQPGVVMSPFSSTELGCADAASWWGPAVSVGGLQECGVSNNDNNFMCHIGTENPAGTGTPNAIGVEPLGLYHDTSVVGENTTDGAQLGFGLVSIDQNGICESVGAAVPQVTHRKRRRVGAQAKVQPIFSAARKAQMVGDWASAAMDCRFQRGFKMEDSTWVHYRRTTFGLSLKLFGVSPYSTCEFSYLDQNGSMCSVPCSSLSILITCVAKLGNGDESNLQPVEIHQVHNNTESLLGAIPFTFEEINLPKLRFSRSTAHNSRKNPSTQEFFRVAVSLISNYVEGNMMELLCSLSEPVLVHGSHPGKITLRSITGMTPATTTTTLTPVLPQYSTTPPQTKISCGWMPLVSGGIARSGPVSINTTESPEALTVQGNCLLFGSLLQPSDGRLKSNLKLLDTRNCLQTIEKIRLYEFQRKDVPNIENLQRGIIAQELSKLLPAAVHQTGSSVKLSDGTSVDNVLSVNKEAVFMENVGATIELSRRVETLGTKVAELDGKFYVLVEKTTTSSALNEKLMKQIPSANWIGQLILLFTDCIFSHKKKIIASVIILFMIFVMLSIVLTALSHCPHAQV
ncbi:myelin regulatory factor [Pelomyxa schiedti]|nr:myelin regulatory factor [Pelomyxa schiedti]